MRILFTHLRLLLPQPQPPHDLLSTSSANGQLVGRWVFLTLALIYYKILKNTAFVRNNRKSLARPRRDKSASETEADLFLESLPAHMASQTAVGRLNLVRSCAGLVYFAALLFLYTLNCPLVCTRRDVLRLAPADKGNYSISGSKHAI